MTADDDEVNNVSCRMGYSPHQPRPCGALARAFWAYQSFLRWRYLSPAFARATAACAPAPRRMTRYRALARLREGARPILPSHLSGAGSSAYRPPRVRL